MRSALLATSINRTQRQLVDMARAVDDGNQELLSLTAHAIKGAAGTIGATGLANLAASIEVKTTGSGTALALGDLTQQFDELRSHLSS